MRECRKLESRKIRCRACHNRAGIEYTVIIFHENFPTYSKRETVEVILGDAYCHSCKTKGNPGDILEIKKRYCTGGSAPVWWTDWSDVITNKGSGEKIERRRKLLNRFSNPISVFDLLASNPSTYLWHSGKKIRLE